MNLRKKKKSNNKKEKDTKSSTDPLKSNEATSNNREGKDPKTLTDPPISHEAMSDKTPVKGHDEDKNSVEKNNGDDNYEKDNRSSTDPARSDEATLGNIQENDPKTLTDPPGGYEVNPHKSQEKDSDEKNILEKKRMEMKILRKIPKVQWNYQEVMKKIQRKFKIDLHEKRKLREKNRDENIVIDTNKR